MGNVRAEGWGLAVMKRLVQCACVPLPAKLGGGARISKVEESRWKVEIYAAVIARRGYTRVPSDIRKYKGGKDAKNVVP